MLPVHLFEDSPMSAMTSQQSLPDEYFDHDHYQNVQTNPNGLPSPPETLNGSSRTSFPPTPSEGALAGRKRSRGDICDPEDDHGDGSIMQFQPAPPPVNRGEPVYGPGMTIVYPNDPSGAYAADASSQSGTWVDEATQKANAAAARPIMATRKSQRLDSSASRSDDISASFAQVAPRAPGTEPLIDEASRLLGISWKRMDISEATQISQRAYTRWITRHYPQLTDVEVWFENNAIPGYLGRATNMANGVQEYYLWSFDLHQAILVTRNPSDLILKLSQPHMSLSQATEKITADVEPVVEAAAANAAIVHNDRFLSQPTAVPASGGMDLD